MCTFAGHIDDQIDIDVQITCGGVVHAKLEIWPAPNEFANIICDEKKGDEGKKEGEEAALSRVGAMLSLGKVSRLLRGVGAVASLFSSSESSLHGSMPAADL